MTKANLARLDVADPDAVRHLALERTDWARRALLSKSFPFNDLSVDCYVQGVCDTVQALHQLTEDSDDER